MRLAAQVKRRIIVSRQDKDFRDTISNAWQDFQAQNPFNLATDAFAMITLRGSDSLLNHFMALLDCARFCQNAKDFEQRLASAGFLNKTARKYYDEICAVIEQAAGASQDADDIFDFL